MDCAALITGAARVGSCGRLLCLGGGSQLDLTCSCIRRRARRTKRPFTHVVRVVGHAERAAGFNARDGGRGRGGARVVTAPTSHRPAAGAIPVGPERVRREVLVVEELEEDPEPVPPGHAARRPDPPAVRHGEEEQVQRAAEERGGAGDEEQAPEAFEAEAVRRERAAQRRAAVIVAEPLALDLAHLVALGQVQDRPRQVRHVLRALGERLPDAIYARHELVAEMLHLYTQ